MDFIGYKGRDVEVAFENGLSVVVACDSCGAIGMKELDVVKVSNYIAGRFTTRVALFEILATGVEPKIVSATICNEPAPVGEEILRGVRDELTRAGVGLLPIAISTEKNMQTQQTGIGISVIGISNSNELHIAATKPGDNLFCLGLPKVGAEVQSPDDTEFVQAEHLKLLLEDQLVHDIIPVGSQGILGEIRTLATALNLSYSVLNSLDSGQFLNGDQMLINTIDLHKSGGPSTCAIFTADPEFNRDSFFKKIGSNCPPVAYLGKFQL